MVDPSQFGFQTDGLQLDAKMTIDRVENGRTIGTVTISTQADGKLKIASSGRLPSGSFRQLRNAHEGLQLLVQTTQQDTLIEHNGKELATVNAIGSGVPRWSIRWWAVFRFAVQRFSDHGD